MTPTDGRTPKGSDEDVSIVRDDALKLDSSSESSRMSQMQLVSVIIGALVVTVGLVLTLIFLLRG